MTFQEHFRVVGDAVGPQPWMQLRGVKTASTPSVAKSYDASDGRAKNDLVQTVVADWENDSPVPQWVYGMVTRGGAQVALQTRSRAYLRTSHGVKVGAGTIQMVDVSRFGTGADIGKGGLLAISSAYAVAELRQNSQTMPLMPQQTGMFLVPPGETITARVEVRFVSEFWESGNIDGGDTGTEAKFTSGDTRLDLFALPSVTTPPPRVIPSIVGGPGNVSQDVSWNNGLNGPSGATTTLATPAGLEAGDVLLAITANQWGLCEDINPYEGGWALAHQRNEGLFGLGDVHMRIWARTVTDPLTEPAQYQFTNNAFPAEAIGVLLALRGTDPYDGGNGSNWFIGSNLSRFQLVEEQVAPSVERQGQFLLAVSYFNHSPTQASINQAPPVGMTELVDIPGLASTMAIAFLANPPFPSFDRRFTPSEIPIFFGHSIAASIVVPGLQQF
ncbi:hypothetical protein H7K45_27660 [Mycobacterium yunnanensis]|uniref:DUF7172 domain-containing protein n=1 Tax=Mycobacterium yunnanensis TaxID=368477 RepID=A0A9X2Z980_9MYCO|nr:hypothetical protein [Mycobacterium yunnanensis]MCV7424329.1 hypothetical protein [Mycobacterium yunnanensis]